MRSSIKRLIKTALRQVGYDIWRYNPGAQDIDHLGIQIYRDLQRLLSAYTTPLIIDVGANVGQSVRAYKDLFPSSKIHSFEPGSGPFEKLLQVARSYPDVFPNKLGVGSATGTTKFLEYEESQWNSFLEPGKDNPGAVEKETTVEVITLDRYCEEQDIELVHLLKTDTQGFDLEVLYGAKTLLSSGRVHFVLTEVIFGDHYKKAGSFDKLLRFLLDNGFKLVAFYDFHYTDNTLAWCDALFVNKNFIGTDSS